MASRLQPQQKSSGRRPVRSYVIRGRITRHQRKALQYYAPRYVIPFTGEVLDLARHFPRAAPLTVEIGFGMGQSLLQTARQQPQHNFLGIEVYPAGIARLMLDMVKAESETKAKIDNLKIVRHDATEVFAQGLTPGCLQRVLILFPDPWPKKRHHKRRLVQPEFMSLVLSRLCVGGQVHLATDWQPYAADMLEVMEAINGAKNVAGRGQFWLDAARPVTKFERRGQGLGHTIYDLLYEKL